MQWDETSVGSLGKKKKTVFGSAQRQGTSRHCRWAAFFQVNIRFLGGGARGWRWWQGVNICLIDFWPCVFLSHFLHVFCLWSKIAKILSLNNMLTVDIEMFVHPTWHGLYLFFSYTTHSSHAHLNWDLDYLLSMLWHHSPSSFRQSELSTGFAAFEWSQDNTATYWHTQLRQNICDNAGGGVLKFTQRACVHVSYPRDAHCIWGCTQHTSSVILCYHLS